MTWDVFPDGGGVGTSATVTGLTNDEDYEFRVAAENSFGAGPYSNVMTATPSGDTPIWTYDFTGTDGAAWSTTYFSSADGTIQGNKGRLTTASTSFSTRYAFTKRSNLTLNFELRFQVTVPTKTGVIKPPAEIAGGDCEFGCAAGGLRLNVDGGIQGTTTITYDAGDTLNWIIRTEGSFRAVKVWPTDVAEPSSWSIEYNLADPPAASASDYVVQVIAVESVGANYDFDNFAWYDLTPPPPAIAKVQSNSNHAGSGGYTIVLPSPLVPDDYNYIIVTMAAFQGGLATPTDSRGHTYTLAGTETFNTDAYLRTYYTKITSAGTCTVTLPVSAGGSATAAEFAGLATTSPVHDAGNANGTGTTFTASATGTLPQANCLVLAVCSHNDGQDVALGIDTADAFSLMGADTDNLNYQAHSAQWKATSATTSVVANWAKSGSSTAWVTQRTTFKGAV